MNEEKLREILKRGDPAAGDPGMTAEEVREMRRTVLSAVPEPRKRGWLVPVLAGAAALVLAAVIALSLWPSPPEEVAVRPPLPRAGEGRGEGAPVVAEKTTPPQPSPAPQEREPPPAPVREPEPEPEPKRKPEPVVLAQADGPTQIQFSTPGGTRVIWVLQPATE